MSAFLPSRKIVALVAMSALFLLSAMTLSACENTYKGMGRDLGNQEMADGFDK